MNVNGLTFEYQFDNEAAALDFPHEGKYYVAVDSRADPYTDESLRGLYLLHFWKNDVRPPKFKFLTKRVTTGRPLLAAITTDRGAGVDPLSLVVGYKQTLLLAAFYDPSSGLVIWLLDGAPKIGVGKTPMLAVSSDYQESKNVDQAGENILPNTAFRSFKLRAVAREFREPKCVAISDHGRFVVDTVCVNGEDSDFVSRRKFAQLIDNRGAHFLTL